MNIEQTVLENGLPCNTFAMLNRLKALLDENGTNCLQSCKDDIRIKAIMWLLNYQVFGQLAIIDMCQLWDEINTNLEKE